MMTVHTIVFVEEGNKIVLLKTVAEALRPFDLDLGAGQLLGRNGDVIALFDDTHVDRSCRVWLWIG